MRWIKSLAVVGILLAGVSTLLAREWSDKTEKFKLQGEYVSSQDGTVKLRGETGKIFRVPLERLSQKDQTFIRTREDVDTFAEFRKLLENLSGVEETAAWEGFLANPDVSEKSLKAARELRYKLDKAAAAAGKSEDLLENAFELMRHRKFNKALVELKRARSAGADSLEPGLAAGVFLATERHDFKKAEGLFRQTLTRGKKNGGLENKSQQTAMIAVMNNMALVRVRQKKYNTAYALWRELSEAKVETPVSVLYNVARVRALISKGREHDAIPILIKTTEEIESRFEELYQALAAGRKQVFSTDVGWLYLVGEESEVMAGLTDQGLPEWHACADRWCFACAGIDEQDCPNGKCKNGTVRAFRYKTKNKGGANRPANFAEKIPYRKPCEACRGKGHIPCQYCQDGKLGAAEESDPRQRGGAVMQRPPSGG